MQGEGSRVYRVRADEGLLTDAAVIEAVAATVLSPATLVRPLARGLDDAAATAVFQAPITPTSLEGLDGTAVMIESTVRSSSR